MPPAPKPMAEVEIPDAFAGCWKGDPGGFDQVYTFSPGAQIGEPGDITFCYYRHSVDVPVAEVNISPQRRALDIAMLLGLGYTSFRAHGIKTDIYSISPATAHGRTTLDVDPTLHVLFVVPVGLPAQPSQVDWNATLVDRDTIRVEAYQVLWVSGTAMFGATWHADFKRSEKAEN